MQYQYPQGTVYKSPENVHYILDDGPFIMCCEVFLFVMIILILEPLVCESSYSVGSLRQLKVFKLWAILGCHQAICDHIFNMQRSI